MHTRFTRIAFLSSLLAGVSGALVASARREPNTPGSISAKELPDGEVPPVNADGNFIIGPTHNRAADMSRQPGVPQGTIHRLTMKSVDSKMYPGIAASAGRSARPIRTIRPS